MYMKNQYIGLYGSRRDGVKAKIRKKLHSLIAKNLTIFILFIMVSLITLSVVHNIVTYFGGVPDL
jgi:hypothetical protein